MLYILFFCVAELEFYNKQLWTKLLGGPLTMLLQSPESIASEACDCLSNMGPIVFNSLKVIGIYFTFSIFLYIYYITFF